jgi:hypothetical protein
MIYTLILKDSAREKQALFFYFVLLQVITRILYMFPDFLDDAKSGLV